MIRRPPRSTLFPTTPLSRPPALSDASARLLPDSPEARMRAADGSGLEGTPGEASQATGAAPGQGGALQQYTVDLTARAKAGELDPVTGRDDEVRQMVDILLRRRQNKIGRAHV